MSDNADYGVRTKLLHEWRSTKFLLARLSSIIDVRPRDDQLIVRNGVRRTPGHISVDIGPLLLNVPERGNHRAAPIFVYLKGSICFSRDCWIRDRTLLTTHMQTEAAYFRKISTGELMLVHGAHHDYAPGQRGHPSFHMQLRGSLREYALEVQSEFGLSGELIDGIPNALRCVRSPTAQLDAFSCVLQIAADHLLPPVASDDQRHAFNGLRQSAVLCGPFCHDGDPQPTPSVEPQESYRCFRARHWYPSI